MPRCLVRSALHTCETTLQRREPGGGDPARLAAPDELTAADGDGTGVGSGAEERPAGRATFADLKADAEPPGLDSVFREVGPAAAPAPAGPAGRPLRRRPAGAGAAVPPPRRPASTGEPRRHPLPVRAALVSAFCLARRQEIAGTPVYGLILLAHTIGVQALSGDSTRVSVMVGIL